jgi:hypothetical protein
MVSGLVIGGGKAWSGLAFEVPRWGRCVVVCLVCDLIHEWIRRRLALGGLLGEYERAR